MTNVNVFFRNNESHIPCRQYEMILKDQYGIENSLLGRSMRESSKSAKTCILIALSAICMLGFCSFFVYGPTSPLGENLFQDILMKVCYIGGFSSLAIFYIVFAVLFHVDYKKLNKLDKKTIISSIKEEVKMLNKLNRKSGKIKELITKNNRILNDLESGLTIN